MHSCPGTTFVCLNIWEEVEIPDSHRPIGLANFPRVKADSVHISPTVAEYNSAWCWRKWHLEDLYSARNIWQGLSLISPAVVANSQNHTSNSTEKNETVVKIDHMNYRDQNLLIQHLTSWPYYQSRYTLYSSTKTKLVVTDRNKKWETEHRAGVDILVKVELKRVRVTLRSNTPLFTSGLFIYFLFI